MFEGVEQCFLGLGGCLDAMQFGHQFANFHLWPKYANSPLPLALSVLLQRCPYFTCLQYYF